MTALLSNPGDLDLRADFMIELLSHGEWQELFSQSEKFIQLAPTKSFGHFLMARGICEMKDIEKASFSYLNAKTCGDVKTTWESHPNLLTNDQMEALESQLKKKGGEASGKKANSGVHFSDIVGMEDLKKKIRLKVVDPYLRPELFEKYGKVAGGGILLYGPPGCGKTMLARAVASEVNAEFISVEVSEVLGAFQGESEKNLAAIFKRARDSKPCVLMFDELDELAFSRSKSASDHFRSLVNEFLNQLDGLDKDNKEILFMAATNMPWDVDAAMKRPGRFNRLLFVPPPDLPAREAMFVTKLKKVPCEGIDFKKLAELTPKASGADIDGLIDSAKEALIEEILESGVERNLEQKDFLKALKTYSPSTSDWLRTANNLVRFGNADKAYQDLEEYFSKEKI